MKKLYIDIDGVLLTVKNTKAADSSISFIQFITHQFDCYWLTTHCKGNTNSALVYLSQYFHSDIIAQLNVIKPTTWHTLKTEAIDFSLPFLWLDDHPLRAELEMLNINNANDKLIIVDLSKQNELNRIKKMLQNFITSFE